MNIAVLILTILMFICSFIPSFGTMFVTFFAVIIIILYVLTLARNNMEKEYKEAFAISSVIIVVSLSISILLNFVPAIKTMFIDDNKIDYDSYYEQKFNDYRIGLVGDEIKLDDDLMIQLVDYTNDGNDYYLKLNIEGLSNEAYYSSYDFILYNETEDETYYPSYYEEANFMSGLIESGDVKNSTLKYELDEDSFEDKLYLIYVNDENGVKIEL